MPRPSKRYEQFLSGSACCICETVGIDHYPQTGRVLERKSTIPPNTVPKLA
jgi:hypothetical protein